MKVSTPLPAPDFSLQDVHGRTINLAGFQGRQHVTLVFLRGFA